MNELERLQKEDREMRVTLGIDEKAHLPAVVAHLVRVVEKVDDIFTNSNAVQMIINKDTGG
jgi:hypothetical protein